MTERTQRHASPGARQESEHTSPADQELSRFTALDHVASIELSMLDSALLARELLTQTSADDAPLLIWATGGPPNSGKGFATRAAIRAILGTDDEQSWQGTGTQSPQGTRVLLSWDELEDQGKQQGLIKSSGVPYSGPELEAVYQLTLQQLLQYAEEPHTQPRILFLDFPEGVEVSFALGEHQHRISLRNYADRLLTDFTQQVATGTGRHGTTHVFHNRIVGGPALDILGYYRAHLLETESFSAAQFLRETFGLPPFSSEAEWHAELQAGGGTPQQIEHAQFLQADLVQFFHRNAGTNVGSYEIEAYLRVAAQTHAVTLTALLAQLPQFRYPDISDELALQCAFVAELTNQDTERVIQSLRVRLGAASVAAWSADSLRTTGSRQHTNFFLNNPSSILERLNANNVRELISSFQLRERSTLDQGILDTIPINRRLGLQAGSIRW